MAERLAKTVAMPPGTDKDLFLRDLWYMPALASSLRPGQMRREMLLGEPVLLGRMQDGEAFALRDICPHRGVPLSAGQILADEHASNAPIMAGASAATASAAPFPRWSTARDLDPEKIRVRSLSGARTGRADLGLYGGQARHRAQNPSRRACRVANADRAGPKPRRFRCGIDHAVIGLMDPAHGPYVHAHWWWKKTPRVKEKHYAPLPNGFVMTAHKPSKPVYSLLGDVTTEITFELPSTRFEIIQGRLFGKRLQGGRPDRLHPARRREHRRDPGLLLAGLAEFHPALFQGAGPHLHRRRPQDRGTAARGPEIQPEPDADPGLRPARHLVPPGQESLGGIGRKRHGIRQSCAGTRAALEKLTGLAPNLGVAAPARPL